MPSALTLYTKKYHQRPLLQLLCVCTVLEVKGKTTFGVIISLYANINAILPVFSGGSGILKMGRRILGSGSQTPRRSLWWRTGEQTPRKGLMLNSFVYLIANVAYNFVHA